MPEVLFNVIDLSHHNGRVDFKKVAESGIKGVILRDGYGSYSPKQIDRRFEENYAGAKENGLYVGAYHYSYSLTVEGMKDEAEFFLKNLKGKSFEMPVYLDFEEASQFRLGKAMNTLQAETFLLAMEDAGAFAGLYSSDSYFLTNYDKRIPKRYSCWVARYSTQFPKNVAEADVGMWQYSCKGKVNGIDGYVDMNYCYKNFPAIIKKAKLNNF